MKNKYLKENLEPLVNTSKSYREVCRKIGISESGNGYKTIKKYIELHNITTEHFLSREEHLLKLKQIKTIDLKDILIENSSYSNNTNLKRKLLKANLLKYECVKCINKGEWNNRQLILQLDHINGNRKDNRIKNLRFLCPNCHSQTSTFCRGLK